MKKEKWRSYTSLRNLLKKIFIFIVKATNLFLQMFFKYRYICKENLPYSWGNLITFLPKSALLLSLLSLMFPIRYTYFLNICIKSQLQHLGEGRISNILRLITDWWFLSNLSAQVLLPIIAFLFLHNYHRLRDLQQYRFTILSVCQRFKLAGSSAQGYTRLNPKCGQQL